MQFQKVFAEILAGTPPTQWREKLEEFAEAAASNIVAQGVAEIARIWLDRVRMREVDAALRNYYRQHVAFPETLAAGLTAFAGKRAKVPVGATVGVLRCTRR